MEPRERQRLRDDLLRGDVEKATRAMCLLLESENPEEIDPVDVIAAMDAMERLGTRGLSRMSESFLLYVTQHAPVTLPVVVETLERRPLSWPGRLSAAVVSEVLNYVPGGQSLLDRGRIVSALIRGVESAGGSESARELVGTLREFARREPVPEAGSALVGLLLRAADEDDPNRLVLDEAIEILRSSGQFPLLAPIHTRAAGLPPHHPLRQALGHPSGASA